MRPGSPVHLWSQFTSANSRPLSRPERKPLNVFKAGVILPGATAADHDVPVIDHHYSRGYRMLAARTARASCKGAYPAWRADDTDFD